jgi:hypothetical protein
MATSYPIKQDKNSQEWLTKLFVNVFDPHHQSSPSQLPGMPLAPKSLPEIMADILMQAGMGIGLMPAENQRNNGNAR